VMTLYKSGSASIVVTDGTISNGTGLSVTVSPLAASRLAWTHVTVTAGTVSSPCLFTCTDAGIGNNKTFTANVSVTDTYGNTVSNVGTGHTVTVSTPTSGSGSGGSFTAPSAGTSVTLTISSTGAADSIQQFTFKTQTGQWTSDTLTAATATGTTYTNATAILTN
jgi:CO/xanthine dehydrogenase Mo-binding subunit